MINCARKSYAYKASLSSYFCAKDLPWSSQRITSETITVYNVTWSCTSTCGNVCYADSVTTIGSSLTNIHYLADDFTYSHPNCYIPTASCNSILSAQPTSNSSESCQGEDPDPEGLYCELIPSVLNQCYLRVYGHARLFYWPVPETVSRDMCAESPLTVMAP